MMINSGSTFSFLASSLAMQNSLTLVFVTLSFSILLAQSLAAQFTLKQIVNIPWGTEQDFLEASIFPSNRGYDIVSILNSNYRSNEKLRTNFYRIYTLGGQTISQFQPLQSKFLRLKLVTEKYAYFTNDAKTFYRYNTQTQAVDSINASLAPYYILNRAVQGKEVILTAGSSGFDCYDANTLKFFRHIPDDKDIILTGFPLVLDDRMCCLKQKDQLAVYDLTTKKVVWTITATRKPLKWLGISVGTYNDSFTHYDLSKDRSVVYAVTLMGSLYKINAATGAILKQIDRFRGDANNAGLITEFALADVNGDGVEDIIGSAVDYNLYAISGKDLSVLWAYNTGYENQAGVALYDITGDGVVDVFSVNDQMKLSIVEGRTGERLYEHQIQPEKSQTRIILADINGNGLLDIFITRGHKAIRAYELPSVKVAKSGVFWMPKW
jgi:PQQ-like domain